MRASLDTTEMGLICVNSGGLDHSGGPFPAAVAIRVTFGNMDTNDEETMALISDGRMLGKTHSVTPASHVGVDPESVPIEA